MGMLGGLGIKLANFGIELMAQEDKHPFLQERIGYKGETFLLPKIQTLARTDLPLGQEGILSKRARLVRETALDELLGFGLVSTNPDEPGHLNAIGWRPRMAETHQNMQRTVPHLYDYWFENVVCQTRPGVLGASGTLFLRGRDLKPETEEYFETTIDADLWYLENASVRLDSQIIRYSLLVGYTSFAKAIRRLASDAPPFGMTSF